MKPVIGFRHGGHLLFILLRVLISQLEPRESRMRYVLNRVVAALRVLKIERPEVDGIISAVIQSMKCYANETPSLFIFSFNVEFDSPVFKNEVIETGKTVSVFGVQIQTVLEAG